MACYQRQSCFNLLRRSLLADGLVSGLSGIILIVGAKPLTSFLGLDMPLILVVNCLLTSLSKYVTI
jgi:hypothetical protein